MMTASNKPQALAWLDAKDPTKTWVITVKEKKSQRSDSQNRLYWAFLGEWAQQYGGTSEEMHQICKEKFLLVEYIEIMGKRFARTQSTPKTNTKEFAEYFESCMMFAASNGFIFETLR
jgi:hypothetical protein